MQAFPSSPAGLFQIGGLCFPQTNVIILYAHPNASSGYATCRRAADSAGYQVTAGKTLKILAWRATVATLSGCIAFGYADTDVGINSTSQGTNSVYSAGNTDNNDIVCQVSGAAEGVSDWKVPATKFVQMRGNGTNEARIQLFCIEV